MLEVWKFQLEVQSRQIVYMPTGAEVLSVGVQNEYPVVWALVNPRADAETRAFTIVTSGEAFSPVGLSFIGTATIRDWYVAHVFEGHGRHSQEKGEDMKQVREELDRTRRRG